MASEKKTKLDRKNVATNRKARFNYEIIETVEAGLVLTGSEVKSLRIGHADISEAFATIQGGEVFLRNVDIPEYAMGGYANHARRRARKLLLHKKEIVKLQGRVKEKGCTLVPLALYFNEDGLAKAEIAVGKGKKHADRREDVKKREADREIRRHLSRRG